MSAFPVILSAPSGGGKTTISQRLLSMRSDIGNSVSATTRPRRANETDGVDYHFLSPEEFERRRLAGDFAEHAEVHGRWYGTLKEEVSRLLGSGKHVLMAIDVQGAAQFVQAFPEAVLIFVLPPSVEVLVSRLKARNTETEESIARRLRTALGEIEVATDYHYVVINDQIEVATQRVSAIIDAESARIKRSHGVDDTVDALIAEFANPNCGEQPEYLGETWNARFYP